MAKSHIERFFLYGEPPRPADERFVHLEFLDDRSRPANWIIRPHAHADLHHLFWISAGGGVADADGRRVAYEAPCVVIVPAGVVHGFDWNVESVGRVLTFSSAHLASIAERDAMLLSAFSGGLWTARVAGDALSEMLEALGRELAWAAPGHQLAVDAQLGLILVQVLRLNHEARAAAHAPISAKAMLVARFRNLVEADFRKDLPMQAFARALGVSSSTLRIACHAAAGVSPAQILHERVILEARRLMRYSNMSVGQIAAYLGFVDPAYFSRFFSKQTGQSPRAFKQSAMRSMTVAQP